MLLLWAAVWWWHPSGGRVPAGRPPSRTLLCPNCKSTFIPNFINHGNNPDDEMVPVLNWEYWVSLKLKCHSSCSVFWQHLIDQVGDSWGNGWNGSLCFLVGFTMTLHFFKRVMTSGSRFPPPKIGGGGQFFQRAGSLVDVKKAGSRCWRVSRRTKGLGLEEWNSRASWWL